MRRSGHDRAKRLNRHDDTLFGPPQGGLPPWWTRPSLGRSRWVCSSYTAEAGLTQMFHHTETCDRQAPLKRAQRLPVFLEQLVEKASTRRISKGP